MTAVQICNFKIYFMLSHTFAIHSIKYMTNMWKQICLPPGWLMLLGLLESPWRTNKKALVAGKQVSMFSSPGDLFRDILFPLGMEGTYPIVPQNNQSPNRKDLSYLKDLGMFFYIIRSCIYPFIHPLFIHSVSVYRTSTMWHLLFCSMLWRDVYVNKMFCFRRGCISFLGPIMKNRQLGGFNNRNVLSHSSGE